MKKFFLETGLYLPGKPITVLSSQISGSSTSIYSGVKVGGDLAQRENLVNILPPPILGLGRAQKVIPNPSIPKNLQSSISITP